MLNEAAGVTRQAAAMQRGRVAGTARWQTNNYNEAGFYIGPEMELKMETKSTAPRAGTPVCCADEIIVSVLETNADSVRIKLWPDAAAVRSRLSVEMAIERG